MKKEVIVPHPVFITLTVEANDIINGDRKGSKCILKNST
jgi:hypothetical protein